MARESTRALMSGFVFSALTFHHVNSGSDSEGFIFGDVKGEAKDCITDSQMSDVEVVYTIDIQRHVPCYQLFRFYNGLGEVDKPALQKLLSGQEKDVIGWYKFRDNTSQTMTLRERFLHENLQTCLSNPGLLFLLVTPQCTTEKESTYRMEYALHKPQDSDFQKMSLIIANLGMSEQQGYKTISGSCVSLGFDQAVKKHRLEFFHKDGTLKEVIKITDMCTSLQEELTETCSRVLESEYSVEQLLQQVNQLKRKIAEKKKLLKNDEVKPAAPEENIFLCQALHHFFPHSAFLQSCRLTLNGTLIPDNCNTQHNITEMDKLTLMIEECDLPEVCFRKSGKRKRLPQKKKASLPLTRTRASTREANHYDNRVMLNSGTETEDDSQHFKPDALGSQSPTF
ncbi:PREDICTED: BRCA1-A complex subunit Abraxas [Nanorana parkeri]|uniref:BRCA1-A complex subunit Abraxas n=1 Tax=Nanorana parkeri TaxID=125878 RepID=UPI0008547C44|nr:PREDICTED: BRCA1-A complex subunit Abraxas [Nanorana parkeri]